jgi:hypothetical protein
MHTYRYMIKAIATSGCDRDWGELIVVEEFWSHIDGEWRVCDILARVTRPEGLSLERADEVLNEVGWKVTDTGRWVSHDSGEAVVTADAY